MAEKKLQQYFGYNNLRVDRQRHSAHEQKQPPKKLFLVDPSALCGIEIEVENIRFKPYLNYYWSSTKDGSLRNNGVEYVSIPLKVSQVEHALNYLTNQIYEVDNEPVFSPRTSVHVHLNVRDFTWTQVKTFILLYAIFERHFFRFAGKTREESIFCVPLYKTEQLKNLLTLEFFTKWHKYSAINVASIFGDLDENVKAYGTIEFRHMYGTLDPKILITWINNICCLRKATFKTNLQELIDKIKVMNTTSEYIGLYQSIFGEYADLTKMKKHDYEFCVSMVKQALFGEELNLVYAYDKNSAYAKVKGEIEPKKEPMLKYSKEDGYIWSQDMNTVITTLGAKGIFDAIMSEETH